MNITLIILLAVLCLLHYTNTTGLLVIFLGLPIEVHVALLLVFVFVRVSIYIYKSLPNLKRIFNSFTRVASKVDALAAKVQKLENTSPFKEGQKRNNSTYTRASSNMGNRNLRREPLQMSGLSSLTGLNKTKNGDNSNRIDKGRKDNLLSSIQSKFLVVKKAVPLTGKFLSSTTFFRQTRLIICLALQRSSSLAYRINITRQFFSWLLHLRANHGIEFVVKYLKSGSVALQKELGKDGMLTPRILEPDLPLPRFTNRLPRIINVQDRLLIKAGHVSVIRFWLSLFNLYRILSMPGKLKLETITNPFTGSLERLEMYKSHAKDFIFFDTYKDIKLWRETSLSPYKLEIANTASPSHRISSHGLMHDIVYMYNNHNELWNNLHYLAYASNPVQTPLMEHLTVGYDIYTEMQKHLSFTGKDGKAYEVPGKDISNCKESAEGTSYLSQLAFKEEAAGKIRVFALLDPISQSFLRPLHDLLFRILRKLPNDGTFDQEESIARSQVKAVKANKAFSFDLTAATDRLPVALSAEILKGLLNNDHYGDYWMKVLTERDFYMSSKSSEKYNTSMGPYRYSVGQPMGGLSSWAMLAITHHWIVQLAAFKAYSKYEWNTDYEILGDDLVIFDEKIADNYLVIMSELGCEINLNKSIVSKSRPVFEFAKRTCIGSDIVSGISFNQIRAGWNVGSRTANAIAFAKSNLISNPNMLLSVLSKNSWNSFKGLKDRLTRISILSLLSAYYQSGKISLENLITCLINPEMGLDFASETVGLPTQKALEVCYEAGKGSEIHSPWSGYSFRKDIFEEHQSFFTVQALHGAVALCEESVRKWKTWIRRGAEHLFKIALPTDFKWDSHPTSDMFFEHYPDAYADLVYRSYEWWGNTLQLGVNTEDPAELLEEAQDLLVQFQYDELLSLEDALKFAGRVEKFQSTVRPGDKPEVPTTIFESASIIPLVRGLIGLQKLRKVTSIPVA